MPILLNQLHVQGVAIHEVPIRHGASPLVLTDGECVLDDDMRAYFAERLRNTLTRAVSVVLDATSPSPVPDVIRGYLQGAVDLLPASQRLATALYSIQTYVNNPGLLALTRLEVGGAGRRYPEAPEGDGDAGGTGRGRDPSGVTTSTSSGTFSSRTRPGCSRPGYACSTASG